MTSFGGAFVGLIFILPILFCLWVGVVGLKKSRAAAWACLFTGAVLISVGFLSLPISTLIMAFTPASGNLNPLMFASASMSIFSILGTFTFAVGFAIHGQKAGRLVDRITELEMMNIAQATELERLRDR